MVAAESIKKSTKCELFKNETKSFICTFLRLLFYDIAFRLKFYRLDKIANCTFLILHLLTYNRPSDLGYLSVDLAR
jgi:hypothetical protein